MLTQKERVIITTILMNYLMNEKATYKEFKEIENIIEKLKEN